MVKASPDGKIVASGDAYRYIFLFDAETKQELGSFGYHSARITGINFNKDSTKMITVGLDLVVGVLDIATKTTKTIHRPNEKELNSAVFDGEDRFFTAGNDCSIRLWSK